MPIKLIMNALSLPERSSVVPICNQLRSSPERSSGKVVKKKQFTNKRTKRLSAQKKVKKIVLLLLVVRTTFSYYFLREKVKATCSLT